MATGDMKNNLRKLKAELKTINYKQSVEWQKINVGLTEPFLPILHFLLADFSCEFSAYLLGKGYEFFGKTDLRFLEVLYKILVQEFSLKPMLTKQQFFSIGFAEIKVIFVTKILSLCNKKSIELLKKSKKKNTKKIVSIVSKDSRIDNIVTEEVSHHASITDKSNYVSSNMSPNIHECLPLPKPELDVTIVSVDENRRDINEDITAFLLEEHKTGVDDNTDMLDLTEQEDGLDNETQLENISNIIEDPSILEDPSVLESQTEVVYDIEEDVLPKFTVTKHYPIIVNKQTEARKLHTHDEQVLNPHFFCHNNKEVNEAIFLNHQARNNLLTQKFVDRNQQQNDACKECYVNKDKIFQLTTKLEQLEKTVTNIVTINSELSAKVVILETKLNFLENNQNKFIESEYNSENNFKENKEENRQDRADVDNDEDVDFTIKTTTTKIKDCKLLPQNKSQEKSTYSPIRYTDDEIIMRDFKPITMKHVLNSYDKNKENVGNSYTNQLSNKRQNYNKNYGESPNISALSLDENTKSTVRNVRQYLKETEMLLNSENNYKTSY